MDQNSFLFQAMVYLAAAVVMVPLAKKWVEAIGKKVYPVSRKMMYRFKFFLRKMADRKHFIHAKQPLSFKERKCIPYFNPMCHQPIFPARLCR